MAAAPSEPPQRVWIPIDVKLEWLSYLDARDLVVGQEVGDGQSMAGLMLLDRWFAARGKA